MVGRPVDVSEINDGAQQRENDDRREQRQGDRRERLHHVRRPADRARQQDGDREEQQPAREERHGREAARQNLVEHRLGGPAITDADDSATQRENRPLVLLKRFDRLGEKVAGRVARRVEAVHHDDQIGFGFGLALRREGLGNFLDGRVGVDQREPGRGSIVAVHALLDIVGRSALDEVEGDVGDQAASGVDSKIRGGLDLGLFNELVAVHRLGHRAPSPKSSPDRRALCAGMTTRARVELISSQSSEIGARPHLIRTPVHARKGFPEAWRRAP